MTAVGQSEEGLPSRRGEQVYNIQSLRAVAAISVAYTHSAREIGITPLLAGGSFGVDIFFVISGYIICYITRINHHDFVAKRLIRILPFYWLATLGLFLLVLAVPHLLKTAQADPMLLLHSLFFIPYPRPDGTIQPLLSLGWTLNYEMYFYALFAIGLVLSPRIAPLFCALALLVVTMVVGIFHLSGPRIDFYASSMVWEFAFGIAAYYITDAAKTYLRSRKCPLIPASLLALLVGSAVFLVIGEKYDEGLPRALCMGLPALVLVTSAVLLETVSGLRITSPAVMLIGESSYILYLIHPYVIFGVMRLALRAPLGTTPLAFLVVVGLIALACIVAIAIHLYYEKPVMARLRAYFLHGARPRNYGW